MCENKQMEGDSNAICSSGGLLVVGGFLHHSLVFSDNLPLIRNSVILKEGTVRPSSGILANIYVCSIRTCPVLIAPSGACCVHVSCA